MARIDATLSMRGDEKVTFHGEPGEMLVMLVDTPHVALTFPNAATAQTWLAVTHGLLMEWVQGLERNGIYPDGEDVG
jgi:hypothetical protein